MSKDISAVKALLRAHIPKAPPERSSDIVARQNQSKELKACLKILRTVVKPVFREYDAAIRSVGFRSSVLEPALPEMPNSIGLWVEMDVPSLTQPKFSNVSHSRIAFRCLPNNTIEVTTDVTDKTGRVNGMTPPVPTPLTEKWVSGIVKLFVSQVVANN